MTLNYEVINSPIGNIHILANTKGLVAITFDQNWQNHQIKLKAQGCSLDTIGNQITKDCCHQLKQYFEGHRKDFTLQLDPQGTAFQHQVWSTLQKIPYGKTWSYQQQALDMKNEKAIRAVARCNGLNPLSIVIPCHRVIGKSGKLTGYAGGLDNKKYLLELEKKFSY